MLAFRFGQDVGVSRDGLPGDRPCGRSARLIARERSLTRDGSANCEIKPSGDLDIWPDALRHVRDHRAQRRSRRTLGVAPS